MESTIEELKASTIKIGRINVQAIALVIGIVAVIMLLATALVHQYPEFNQGIKYFYPLCFCWAIILAIAIQRLTAKNPSDFLIKEDPTIDRMSSLLTGLCIFTFLCSLYGILAFLGLINVPEPAGNIYVLIVFLLFAGIAMTLVNIKICDVDARYVVKDGCMVTINGIDLEPKQAIALFPWKKYDIS